MEVNRMGGSFHIAPDRSFSINHIHVHQKSAMAISGESAMPGMFFSYKLSPLMVKFAEKENSFGHFLVNICGIIGGIFTVERQIRKKMDLGKFT